MANQKGYTFVETLVALGLFSVMGVAILTLTVATQRYWQIYSVTSQAQQEVQKAITMLSSDLRVGSGFMPISMGNNIRGISFSKLGVGVVSYNWQNFGNNAFRLIRTIGPSAFVGASNISFVNFTAAGRVVDIDIRSQVVRPQGYVGSFQLLKKVSAR